MDVGIRPPSLTLCFTAEDDSTEFGGGGEGERGGGMLTLTCNACNKEFDDEAQQKQHYRSEWHRYNLKRKVMDFSGLPRVRLPTLRILELIKIFFLAFIYRGFPFLFMFVCLNDWG